jgi:hypothetical protein
MGVGRGGFDPRVLMWINIIIVGGAIGFLLVVILFVLADEGLDSFKETKKDD